MSVSAAPMTKPVAPASYRRASLTGLVRGELRKIVHLRITWALLGLFTLFVVGSQLILVGASDTKDQLIHNTPGSFSNLVSGDLSILRVFSGIAALVLAAHVIGLEYQHGTIRILLGRGVGRLQLLGAKMAALTLVLLALLGWGLLIQLAFAWGLVVGLAGDAAPWRRLGDNFWVSVRFYLLCVLISLGVTLLLGVAATILGRSLAFGLAVGLNWFAVDNLASIPLTLGYQFTHSDLWLKVSGFLLGPLLNRLPDYIAPPWHAIAQTPTGPVTVTSHFSGFGALPLTPVSSAQALTVIGAYAVVFALIAVIVTWRRETRD
jgi:ABC-type transport system involved in multi-copper enzyme maturation permease subunit